MKGGVGGQGQGELWERAARAPEGPEPVPTEEQPPRGPSCPSSCLGSWPISRPNPHQPGGRGLHLPHDSGLPGTSFLPTPGCGQVTGVSITCDHVLLCPSAQVETPFYEEWWFLLVMALSSLIVILLVVFALVLHGQNRRYRSCGTGGVSASRSACPWAIKQVRGTSPGRQLRVATKRPWQPGVQAWLRPPMSRVSWIRHVGGFGLPESVPSSAPLPKCNSIFEYDTESIRHPYDSVSRAQ